MGLNELGVGSIVEVHGNLYRKRVDGWVVLSEVADAYMGGVQDFEVIASVEKGPLDDFVKGDVISFEGMCGTRIAVKHRDDFWMIAGNVAEWASDELVETFSGIPDSVRKVGSISG